MSVLFESVGVIRHTSHTVSYGYINYNPAELYSRLSNTFAVVWNYIIFLWHNSEVIVFCPRMASSNITHIIRLSMYNARCFVTFSLKFCHPFYLQVIVDESAIVLCDCITKFTHNLFTCFRQNHVATTRKWWTVLNERPEKVYFRYTSI